MGRISAWPKYLVVYDSIASLISVSSRCSSVSHKSELYEGCSKSIRDFFPRKLMKHGRFAVVGRWRVPSCAYVDFFPPADNVSHVQPACEWECIHSARWIVIFCVNVILWLKSSPFQLHFQVGGSANNHKEPCQESRVPVEPQECCVWPRKFESASARISRTLFARPNYWSKWNVPNQCLSPPPPQVPGRWHDGPAWPKSALGWWHCHFG